MYFDSKYDRNTISISKLEGQEEEKIIVRWDIYFFYRPKVDAQEVKDIENVQRFYMVISPG